MSRFRARPGKAGVLVLALLSVSVLVALLSMSVLVEIWAQQSSAPTDPAGQSVPEEVPLQRVFAESRNHLGPSESGPSAPKGDQAETHVLQGLLKDQAAREAQEKQVRDRLDKPFHFHGFDDPKTSLGEVLDQFQIRHGVTFVVNERAFRFEQVADVLKTGIVLFNPIEEMPCATLKGVLEKVLARVEVPSGAVFLVVGNKIEITTGRSARFQVPANTPPEKSLPVPPPAKLPTGPLLGDDLREVPEVAFQEPPARNVAAAQALEDTAWQLARIDYLNEIRTDGFIELLRARRPDLAGLPFLLGDDCRTTPERNTLFAPELRLIRQAIISEQQKHFSWSARMGQDRRGLLAWRPDQVWSNLPAAVARERDNDPKLARSAPDATLSARVAAQMQILWPENEVFRLGIAEYLATVPHAEATRALARVALFAPEVEIRQYAVKALQARRERDYTDVLMQGFRYPWPAAASRTSEALVALGRADLASRLIDVLEEPDPRAPLVQEVEGQRVPMVRELVRINHQRSCQLCHPPMSLRLVSANPSIVTGAVPIPGQPLPALIEYYSCRSQPDPPPEILVRADVTYLRQDFSQMQRVADADPWPAMQRFDFLVRTRTLTEEEAQRYRDQLQPREPGVLSPYHQAALAALRELTGKDAEPTADAWRKLLREQVAPTNQQPQERRNR